MDEHEANESHDRDMHLEVQGKQRNQDSECIREMKGKEQSITFLN